MSLHIWAKLLLFWRTMRQRAIHRPHDKYRPEEHYMRGPGPAAHRKALHDR